MTEKKNPGAEGGTPGRSDDPTKDTTTWCLRQLVKFTLPYIAAIVTTTRFTDRKSRFLDRLIILAEGGGDE